MSIALYMDVHVREAVTLELRRRGVDVLMAKEDNANKFEDAMLLDRAMELGRVLFTQDEDFLKLHASGVEHAGIAYTPQGAAIGDIIRGLMLIQQVLNAEEMRGHIEYL